MYAPSYNEGFQRFSVAHELGHYFLDGHCERILSGGVHASHAGFVSRDPYESAADTFAAALLLPADLWKAEVWKHEHGLSGILSMAEIGITSVTATAIRYAELSERFLMVVISTNGIIDYCVVSPKVFRLRGRLGGIELPKRGLPVPPQTTTYYLSQNLAQGASGACSGARSSGTWVAACNQHDIDYGTLGMSKAAADRRLRDNMIAQGAPSWVADFYVSVLNGSIGQQAYNNAQAQARRLNELKNSSFPEDNPYNRNYSLPSY
jgi:hypothetical protein